MEIIKYHKDNRSELGRITVPLEYGGKETWVQRLMSDPNLHKGVQITLPIMSYEMISLSQDREKQMTSYFNNSVSQSGNVGSKFTFAVPYEMLINLNIYVRNMEDGLQIIEQIVPFFTPDYTVSIKYAGVNGCSIVNDLPFILENLTFTNSYEGVAEDVRFITWTLTFKAEILLYGPINANSSIIKTSTVNIRDFDGSNIEATVVVTPNPSDANVGDVWVANTRITEF
jgi:hypothetical protein